MLGLFTSNVGEWVSQILRRAIRMGQRLSSLLRVRQWLQHKIAPLLVPLYFLALHDGITFYQGVGLFLGLLVYLLVTAALGYFLNDLGDMDSDARAGKPNLVGRLSRRRRLFVLVALLGGSAASLALLPPSPLLFGLAAAEILCFVAYSFPPTRLKERYVSIVVDALYAHVLPFSIVVAATSAILVTGNAPPLSKLLVWFAFLWQSFQGVRHILGHQLLDFAADSRSNTKTFAVRIGEERARMLHRYVLPALETAAFLGLLWSAPFGHAALAFYLAFVFWIGIAHVPPIKRGYRPGQDPNFFDRFATDFSNLWLPTIILVLLAGASPPYALVLLVHLLIFGLPRIGFAPSPPSWHIETQDATASPNGTPALRGWCLVSEFSPARIEAVLDGWPVAAAPLDRYCPDVAAVFAQPREAIRGFELAVPLDQFPPSRQAAELQLIAVLANGGRFRLHRDRVVLPPDRPATAAASWACVYAHDWRPNLLRDTEGRPEKIVLVHSCRASEIYVEPALRDALERRGFRVITHRLGETNMDHLLTDCETRETNVLLCVAAVDWTASIARPFRDRGWLCVSFAIDDDAWLSVEARALLDFFGPYTTPVFNRFATRFLGVEAILNAEADRDSAAA